MKTKSLLFFLVISLRLAISAQPNTVLKYMVSARLILNEDKKVLLLRNDTFSIYTTATAFSDVCTNAIKKDDNEGDKALLAILANNTSYSVDMNKSFLTEESKAKLTLRIADILESRNCEVFNRVARHCEQKVIIEKYATPFVSGRRFKTEKGSIILETVDTTDAWGKLVPIDIENDSVEYFKWGKIIFDTNYLKEEAFNEYFAIQKGQSKPVKMRAQMNRDSLEVITKIHVRGNRNVFAIVQEYLYDTTQTNMRSGYVTHYFRKGNTFAIERKYCFVNSKLNNELICRRELEYFTRNLRSVYQELQVTNKVGDGFADEELQYPIDIPRYEIKQDARSQLLWYGIDFK